MAGLVLEGSETQRGGGSGWGGTFGSKFGKCGDCVMAGDRKLVEMAAVMGG